MKKEKFKLSGCKKMSDKVFYKKYFILNEFSRELNREYYATNEKEIHNFINTISCYDMVEDFSKYGKDLIDLEFNDYFKSDICFLCYINFNFDEFMETMYSYLMNLEE